MWRKRPASATRLASQSRAAWPARAGYSAAAASLMRFDISARPATEDDHPRVTAVCPPSITMSWPLTNREAVAGKKHRRLRDILREARSRDRLNRGEALFHHARQPVGLGAFKPAFFPKIPVTIAPGEMQLTRMPFSPSSAAAERVSALTAPFDAL